MEFLVIKPLLTFNSISIIVDEFCLVDSTQEEKYESERRKNESIARDNTDGNAEREILKGEIEKRDKRVDQLEADVSILRKKLSAVEAEKTGLMDCLKNFQEERRVESELRDEDFGEEIATEREVAKVKIEGMKQDCDRRVKEIEGEGERVVKKLMEEFERGKEREEDLIKESIQAKKKVSCHKSS